MPLETLAQLERLGFSDILLWLLTFAVVYGVLGQANLPKSAASRAIIAISSGIFVLLAAPATLISIISKMSMNLVLLILGLLVIIVFLEASGAKVVHGELEYAVRKGKGFEGIYTKGRGPESVFKKHGVEIGVILLILVVLIFIGSGGLSVLGLQNVNLGEGSIITIGIIVAVILAVLFLYSEKGDKEEE